MSRSTLTDKQRREIIDAITAKSSGSRRFGRKMWLWRFTVGATHALKRGADVVFSILALVILSPFLIGVALAIRIDSPGSVIFRQVRVGRDGRHFNFYKFRSMYINSDSRKQELMPLNESGDGVIFKMKADPRITRVGGFIRKFSIDELPQLFNVLIGEMSLVGPRPPVPSEVAHYTLEDRKRLHVTPGITCLWQISGRSDIPFHEQVLLDKQYIASSSLWRDFLILLKTIPAVLTGRGAY